MEPEGSFRVHKNPSSDCVLNPHTIQCAHIYQVVCLKFSIVVTCLARQILVVAFDEDYKLPKLRARRSDRCGCAVSVGTERKGEKAVSAILL
jgi:hypothetical protein